MIFGGSCFRSSMLFFSFSSAARLASRRAIEIGMPVFGRRSVRKTVNSVSFSFVLSGQRAKEKETEFTRSEEHTSELQSLRHLVCRLLLEKKKAYRTRRLRGRLHPHLLRR